jgi:hypothetical protein
MNNSWRTGVLGRQLSFLLLLPSYLFGQPQSVNSVDVSESINAPTNVRIHSLCADLEGLNCGSAASEAFRISRVSILKALEMRHRDKPVSPALLNNLLINIGIRRRGLCYQWAAEIFNALNSVDLKEYNLRWGTSYMGYPLREHNCVVITARGAPFANGIVLDGWRYGGRLFWSKVSDDKKFRWREVEGFELDQRRLLGSR